MFNVEYIQQCKIKFEPPKQKWDIAQCANCQRYGHTKNYCHFKPKWVKCAGDHLTNQCHKRERPSDVQCVLCGGNHPLNYKGCMVYKDLQKKTYPPLFENIHSSLHESNKHCTRSNICSDNPTKFLHFHKYRARATHKPILSANQQCTGIKKYDEKPFWTNGNYAKPHSHA
jgi:hypothetical protein